jgi:hypothetical protein
MKPLTEIKKDKEVIELLKNGNNRQALIIVNL